MGEIELWARMNAYFDVVDGQLLICPADAEL